MLTHKNVLVVAAHPDDETLGAGGLIARLADMGARVTVLILGEGVTSRQPRRDPAAVAGELERLRGQAQEAGRILGASRVIHENLPDNRFDGVELLDIVKIIERTGREANPALVLTHHAGDLNIDHVLTHRATLTAFRPLPGREPVSLYAFETPSSTEYAPPSLGAPFTPSAYVDIAEAIERKIAALKIYDGETFADPHPRSPESVRLLAAVRGRQSGRTFAEAFVPLRELYW